MDSSIAAEMTTPIASTLTAAALKEISHDQHSNENDSVEFDPLATSTSVPSSDDGLDDDEESDAADKTETVQPTAVDVDTAPTDATTDNNAQTAEDNQEDVEISPVDATVEDSQAEVEISPVDDATVEDSQEDVEISPTDATIEDNKEDAEIAPVATPDAIVESHAEAAEESKDEVEVAPVPTVDATPESHIETAEESKEVEVAPIPTADVTADNIARTIAESEADNEVAAVFTEGEQLTKEKEQENVVPKAPKPELSIETTPTTVAKSKTANQEPYTPSNPSTPSTPSSSRSLSREELRRRSSFFNSKDIAISNMRYPSTASSLRPIADPRYKNRFQNVLAEWKARANASKA